MQHNIDDKSSREDTICKNRCTRKDNVKVDLREKV